MSETNQKILRWRTRIQSDIAQQSDLRMSRDYIDRLIGAYSPNAVRLGLGIWIAANVIIAFRLGRIDWITNWMLLAPLVIAPLGWRLAVMRDLAGNQPLFRLARRMWLAGSVLLASSFLLNPGIFAALLATPWLIVCGLAVLAGLRAIKMSEDRSPMRWMVVAALLMMPVGAGWAIASRWGLQPMGFKEPIVLLTGVHFHYAGFAAPLIAAAVGSRLVGRLRGLFRLHCVASIGVITGVLLLAAGFVVSPILKLLAAVILAMSLTMVAAAQMILAAGQPSRLAKGLMIVSSLAVVVGMGLAVVYSVGEYRGDLLIDIPAMAALHGFANGPGFALCGLLAWNMRTE